MHVRVSVFDPSWGAVEPIDLELDAPTGTPWSLVAPRVSKVLAAQGRCVPVDATFRAGRRLAPEDRLGLDPLVHGALLVVDGGSVSGAGAPAGRGLLELHVVGGHGAGRVVCLGRGTHLLGRAASCAVRLDDPGASRAHAALTVGESGIHLRDLNPTNRSTVGASPLPREGAVLAPGDRVRVASTTVALRRMPDPSPRRPARDGRVPIHRPPRIGARRAPVQIVFPDPAPGPRAPQLPLVALLAPLVVSGLLALGLHAVTMLLFGLLSPLLLLGQWAGDRRQGRRAHRRQSEQHARRTAEARARLDVALAAEAAERDRDHPDLATMAVVARQRAPSLWCRHPGDDNHLVVRLGTATQPAVLTVSGGGVAAPSVDHAPAVVSLRDVGVLGLTGPRGVALSLAGAVVAQLATWQSPREVRIAVLADSPDAERDWCWAAWLPHWLPLASAPTMPSPGSPGRADTVGHPKDGPDELATWVEGRRAGRAMSGAPEPELVVVLDGAQTLRGHAGVAGLLQHGPAMGVHIVCIATHHDELPPETSACLTLGSDGSSAALMGPTSTLDGIIPDLPTAGWLEAHARSLAPLEDAAPRHQEGTVPAHVGFRALHRADRVAPCDPVDASSVAARWSAHAGAARAVLGTAATGPYALDLATDGPHLLVGGTTGSGKSELLRTLVTSLAVSTPPDALSFVLVDYKGGAAFRDCARLPHTVGLVTDLDEHLTRRALSSLDAELRRRERLFASVGAADLAGYDRLRRADSLRIPRMVLVVDEFKLLADDLPGFVAGLVRIAAVGRSLGVHLVLATQRPAGIITGDMRANVQLRIALRMRDRGDSLDVVDGPEAAALSERFPGRALVRGAGDRLVELQTAQISARFEDAPDSGADVAVRLAAGGDSRTPSAAAPLGGRGADDG
ncbi:MAG TPA: FtsK/SpoIIIE domain-containing protein, partial [Intrasporangium sp.]|uniref:FtsK/SpoIIIE domain-containing protein n=1 Tax=Intrasporangium sp. TaxID=1925024 RepID=UPI002D7970C3